MTKEFKKIADKSETRYVLESATVSTTSAASISTAPGALGELQKRLQELKDKVPQKPRQGPLRPQTGAGVHKNKKKDQQRGIEKHKGQSVYQEEFNGEYDDEAGMVKNNIHTIVRVMSHLEREIADNENLPEWVQEKIASAKGMLVSVMDYMLSQHEMGIAPKQGVAEGSPRTDSKAMTRAIDNWNRIMTRAEREAPGGEEKHQQDVKQRIKTTPIAGPKGVLPKEGAAEGSFDGSPEYELLQSKLSNILINYYHEEYTEEEIRMMRDIIATRLKYDPKNKQFQSAFNAALTSPDQNMAEGQHPEYTAIERELVKTFKDKWHGGSVSVDRAIQDTIEFLLRGHFLDDSQRDAAEEFLDYYVADMEQQPEEPHRDHEEDRMGLLGVAEGADIEYIVSVRDKQGEEGSIRVSALTPTGAKEKAKAQGYKVIAVKDPQETDSFKMDRSQEEFEEFASFFDGSRGNGNPGAKNAVELMKAYNEDWKPIAQRIVAYAEDNPDEVGYDVSNAIHDLKTELQKGVAEDGKKKGADGKACWKGYRYAGTKNGKDDCVKVGEDIYTEHLLSQLQEKFASQQQAKLMYAVAGDRDVAKKTGVSTATAREFIKKSHGQQVKDLPKKVKKK